MLLLTYKFFFFCWKQSIPTIESDETNPQNVEIAKVDLVSFNKVLSIHTIRKSNPYQHAKRI